MEWRIRVISRVVRDDDVVPRRSNYHGHLSCDITRLDNDPIHPVSNLSHLGGHDVRPSSNHTGQIVQPSSHIDQRIHNFIGLLSDDIDDVGSAGRPRHRLSHID